MVSVAAIADADTSIGRSSGGGGGGDDGSLGLDREAAVFLVSRALQQLLLLETKKAFTTQARHFVSPVVSLDHAGSATRAVPCFGCYPRHGCVQGIFGSEAAL